MVSSQRAWVARTAVGLMTVGGSAMAVQLATAASAAPPNPPTPPAGYNATINQGNVPTTASGFSSHDCGEFTGKSTSSDGWLFVASPSTFTKLQAQFSGGTVIWTSPSSVSGPAGTSAVVPANQHGEHVGIITPAGWTLNQAYAALSGSKTFFTLSHTCPATTAPPPTQSPTPTQSTSSSQTPTPSQSASQTATPTQSSSSSQTPTSSVSSTGSTPPTSGQTSAGATPTQSTSVLPTQASTSPAETSSPTASATTTVLGETQTATPTPTSTVLGERQSRLPFTGLRAGALLLAGGAALLGGLVLLLAGARPYSRRH